jgi:hypothetical protein
MSTNKPYRNLNDIKKLHEKIIAEYVEWQHERDTSPQNKYKKHNALLRRCLMKCIEEYPDLGESPHVKFTLEECTK